MSRPFGFGRCRRRLGGAAFSPVSLFTGTQGVWYDPSDLASMRQGTTIGSAAAAVDAPVGYRLDKSGNGNHAVLQAGTATLRQAGALFYIEYSAGAYFQTALFALATGGEHSAAVAMYAAGVVGVQSIVDADDGGGVRLSQMIRLNGATPESIPFTTAVGVVTDSCANVSATTATVLSQVTTATAVEIFKNGVGNGSTARTGTPQSNPTYLDIGATKGGAQTFTGRDYGVIELARAFTAGERAAVEAYLAAKAGF